MSKFDLKTECKYLRSMLSPKIHCHFWGEATSPILSTILSEARRKIALEEVISSFSSVNRFKLRRERAREAAVSWVFTGKPNTRKWIGFKRMLKYSDIFLVGCRMINIAP